MHRIELIGKKPGKQRSLPERILEATQVGLWILTFCAITIAGASAIAWLVLMAMDPHHSAGAAAVLVAQFDRTPFGIAAGLAVFFAAVTWDSARMRRDTFEESVNRRLTVIEKRLGIPRDREVG